MSERFVVPYRSSSAPSTSGSSSINSCTISSLEIVAAPCRANERRASLFPAPMPPVIATLSGLFGCGLVGLCGLLGLGDHRLGLGLGDRLGLRDRLGLGLDFGYRARLGVGLC